MLELDQAADRRTLVAVGDVPYGFVLREKVLYDSAKIVK